jgi:transposase
MFVAADNFVFQNPAQRKLAERWWQGPKRIWTYKE